jgi:hypothetical protein
VNARALAACNRTAYDEMTEQRCEWFGTVVVQRLTTQGHGVKDCGRLLRFMARRVAAG